MRNINTGSKKDERWRTADTVERCNVRRKGLHLSCADGNDLTLMDPENFEQSSACRRTLWATRRPSWWTTWRSRVHLIEGVPVAVALPEQVVMKLSRPIRW